MKVYQTEDRFVLGVAGGVFYALKSEPEVIISIKRPLPTKWWTVKRIKDRTLFKGEEWTVDTESREFLCDEKKVCILQFKYFRTKPGYCSASAEFFVSEEYAEGKISLLRKMNKVKEYSWDEKEGTWKEVNRKKYYRKV